MTHARTHTHTTDERTHEKMSAGGFDTGQLEARVAGEDEEIHVVVGGLWDGGIAERGENHLGLAVLGNGHK